MPRKRDPNKPIKLRTKLDTAEQINDELRRTYRLQRNKQITAAEAKSWRELLVALRSGLPETVERPDSSGAPLIIDVRSAAEGQVFLPGNEVLAPLEFAREVWLAFNAGSETWQAHLTQIEGQLTRSAFENLSRVPPLERKTLLQAEEPHLRLVQEQKPAADPEIEVTPQDERLLVELLDQFRTLATRYGIDTGSLSLPGGDDAA